MKSSNPIWWIDAYKIDHRRMYPSGTEFVYSNFTPRYSLIDGVTEVTFFGLQAFLKKMRDSFDEWFKLPESVAVEEYSERCASILGPNNVGVEHIRDLHRLGFLPLEFKSLPEGTRVPLKVPMFTVENTDPRFFWLTNYIESALSAEIWKASTSATLAARYRSLCLLHARKTNPEAIGFVDWQCHDFSFRGMDGVESASRSGAGHLLSFNGSDTIPAIDWVREHYGMSPTLGSVAATEHSVMCAGGKESESETFARLLDLYPSGILSVVSDTWDLWSVLTKILPEHKSKIMGRDGKLVIRPDSGNPVDILCGDESAEDGTPARKGVIELLWDEFGGTVSSAGFKCLDQHIGAIYGDSITYERAGQIFDRLEKKGFASTNVVLGIGSFTYQYNTRDTFGFAMKATWAQINGEGINLFKDPVTDKGGKRSATGRLAVLRKKNGGPLVLVESATESDERFSQLQTVFRNGIINWQSWDSIVNRVRGL